MEVSREMEAVVDWDRFSTAAEDGYLRRDDFRQTFVLRQAPIRMAPAGRCWAKMTLMHSLRALLLGLFGFSLYAHAQQPSVLPHTDTFGGSVTRRELRIPMAEAGPAGLEAWLFLPDSAGKHPLVLLTHGWVESKSDRREMGPGALEPEALWFVRRGWAAAVVLQRGYGDSGGDAVRGLIVMGQPGLETSYQLLSLDLQAAYDALTPLPEIDGTRVIVAGEGDGGLTAISFGVKPSTKLKGIINFGGPWYSLALSAWAAKSHQKTSFTPVGSDPQVPELWIYAKYGGMTDAKYVGRIYDAWKASGRDADFVLLDGPPEGVGSPLQLGQRAWGPAVEQFLSANGLPSVASSPDAVPTPMKLPSTFSDSAQKAYLRFETLGPYRAFAVGPNGRWGFASGKRSLEIAEREAIDNCGPSTCRVISVGK
jgi:dienelactone hydrolase